MHAAAAAKSLQSCLTLCNPVDGSPLDSSVPGILQARILHTSHQCQLPGLDQSVQFSSVAQSCPTLCDPMNHSTQASLSITNSRSSLRLTAIKSVMPSSHLILCCPLLLLPPIPPSIRVFSNESTLHMRWPKYWNHLGSFKNHGHPSTAASDLISMRDSLSCRIFKSPWD